MTTQQDSQVGLKKESTYGTPVTVDFFPEYLSCSWDWQPNRGDAGGLRTGIRVKRSDRRALLTEMSGGDLEQRMLTKGLGKIIEAVLGTGSSANITGAAYLQSFTLGDTMPSYTTQTGVPLQAGGAQQPSTFAGMMATALEISQPNGDFATVKSTWTGKSHTTGTALATASYATGMETLGHPNLSVTIGGTVTAPTSTTLATNGTAVTNVRELNLSIDRQLDQEGHTFVGSAQRSNKPELGEPLMSGSLTADFTGTTLRDAWLADTTLPLVATWVSPTQIGATGQYPSFQVYLPAIKLEGELPKASTDGTPVRQSIDFTVYDGLVAAQPIYIGIITLETAI